MYIDVPNKEPKQKNQDSKIYSVLNPTKQL